MRISDWSSDVCSSDLADGIERVEIVRDDEHRQAQRVAQRADEVVELAGADRIEPCGRLIEEKDRRVESERTRDAGALAHPAGKIGRIKRPGARRQSRQPDLEKGDVRGEGERKRSAGE